MIGTGGTISSLGRDPLDLVDYPDSGTKLEVDELIDRFPVVGEIADLVPVRCHAVGSTRIGPAEWLELAGVVHATAEREPGIARSGDAWRVLEARERGPLRGGWIPGGPGSGGP